MKFLSATIFGLASIAVAAPDGARYLARDAFDELNALNIEARQCIPGGFLCLSDRWCCSGSCVGGSHHGYPFFRIGRCSSRSTTSRTSSTTRSSTSLSTSRTSVSPITTTRSTSPSTTRTSTSSSTSTRDQCTSVTSSFTSVSSLYEYRGFTYTGMASTYKTYTVTVSCPRTTTPISPSTTSTGPVITVGPITFTPSSSPCLPSYVSTVANGQTQVYTYDPPCAFPTATSTKLIHSGCPPVQPMVMTSVMQTAVAAQRSGSYYLSPITMTMTYTSQPDCANYPVQHTCSPSYRYGITETFRATVDARGNTQGITFFPTTITYTSYPESCPTVASSTPSQSPSFTLPTPGTTTYPHCGPYIRTTTSVPTSNSFSQTLTFRFTDYVPCPATSIPPSPSTLIISPIITSTTRRSMTTSTKTPCVASTGYFTQTITELSVSARVTKTVTRTQTYTAIYDPPCAFGGN